jgi:ATP-binding cassette subfamily C (CFTR/MRP) protein 4
LFRLVDSSEGTIEIDGVDLKSVGLHKLRQSIGYIPQSPFLLVGSVRENLDVFGKRTDDEIWEVLREVQMDAKIREHPDELDQIISDSNTVLSVGQKQLMCLARALLQRTKIIVLDEATANIDLQTDNLIQSKLREKFFNNPQDDSTVLIIAHRMVSVIDADRILVMNDGKNKEFDHPFKLLVENEDD